MPLRFCSKCNKVVIGEGVTHGGKLYHKECMICAYCGGELTGAIATYRGQFFHTECNPASGKKVCAYCRKPLKGSWHIQNGKNYHHDCFHKYVEKRCSICGQAISGTYTYDNWGNCAHMMHGAEKTRYCHSCGRIISGSFKQIGANAVLCSVCATSSVTTSKQVEACRKKVISVFKSLGISGVPEDIPVELKSKDLMGKALGRIHYSWSRNRRFSNFHIFMTLGLPELHFRGVLAHEMLHSWLVLYGREVTDDECEGFCNLGSGFVYQKEDTDFSRLLLKRLYENADKIYGEGYRLQKERYEKLGWAGLLDSLRYK